MRRETGPVALVTFLICIVLRQPLLFLELASLYLLALVISEISILTELTSSPYLFNLCVCPVAIWPWEFRPVAIIISVSTLHAVHLNGGDRVCGGGRPLPAEQAR